MSLAPIRPRFSMVVPGTVQEQMARIQAAVTRPESRCVSRTLGQHVDVTIVKAERHRWSPCVQIELSQADDETIVDGLVGPHPNTWTLFAFVNLTIAIVSAFGLMLGCAQLSLREPPWGLWAVLGGATLLVIMYLAAQVGRRLAAEQTRLLLGVLEEALGARVSSPVVRR